MTTASVPLCLPWFTAKGHPSVYPVFLPFRGCRRRCIYCAQESVTGKGACEALSFFLQTAERDLRAEHEADRPPPELAFYGGTFTDLPEEEFVRCLAFAEEARKEGLISSVRCSTRPDSLTEERLSRMKDAGFRTVELGVQTFVDAALTFCGRMYTADVIRQGTERVRSMEFSLGIQLLPGLPETDASDFLEDVQKALSLGADLLRFYPCVVLEHTGLARLWREGRYVPWSSDRTVEVLAKGYRLAQEARCPVIRMGLPPQKELRRALLAGPWHPALGARVQARALFDTVQEALSGSLCRVLRVPRQVQGFFWGDGGELRDAWRALGVTRENLIFEDRETVGVLPEGQIRRPDLLSDEDGERTERRDPGRMVRGGL